MEATNQLKNWLENIRLSEYFEEFVNQGYDHIDDLTVDSVDDILRDVNITKPGHQKRLKLGISTLESGKKNPPEKPCTSTNQSSTDTGLKTPKRKFSLFNMPSISIENYLVRKH